MLKGEGHTDMVVFLVMTCMYSGSDSPDLVDSMGKRHWLGRIAWHSTLKKSSLVK